MKTARTIEEQGERKQAKHNGVPPANRPSSGQKRGRGDATRIAAYRFKPGQSGNPNGRPKNDIAAKIARAVFENNEEKLYIAYGKQALKGNAYAFQVLADRAYGKLKERHEYELTPYRDTSEADIHARIAEIESRLGYAGIQRVRASERAEGSAGGCDGRPQLTGRVEPATERTEPPQPQILPPASDDSEQN